MTQEDKELLLRDLCGRLPYSVKIKSPSNCWTSEMSTMELSEIFKGDDGLFRIGDTGALLEYSKPYLFPMSSMTEKQRKQLESITHYNIELHADRYYNVVDIDSFTELQEFYNRHHLDYNNLISLGLAIDATGKNIY